MQPKKIEFEQLCGHFNPNPYDCKNKVKAEVRKQLDFFMFFAFFAQGGKTNSYCKILGLMNLIDWENS